MIRGVTVGAAAALWIALVAPARADLRVAVDNDTFSASRLPFDDDGFTNDIDVRFWRPFRGYQLGGRLFDRWITEVPRPEGRRRDQLDLLATLERTWIGAPGREVTIGGRAGPTFGGNLGGRWGQNNFHKLCHCGNTLEEGLQNRYEGRFDAGALLGTRIEGRLGIPDAQAYGVVDTQLAVGAGVSFLDAAVGGRVAHRFGRTTLGAHGEIALIRFAVWDEGLGLPGGYRPGWQSAYRLGFEISYRRFQFAYEYRANEGGSGEPIGMIAFTFKQAGTTF